MDLLFTRVIPALPKGVVIHVHDIFLPDPCPIWAWRGYGKHLLVDLPRLWRAEAAVRQSLGQDTSARGGRGGVIGSLPLPDVLHESSLWLIEDTNPVAA